MSCCGNCQCPVKDEKNLCKKCTEKLVSPEGFCAEQLFSTSLYPTNSALLDRWGRVHFLEQRTIIGRKPTSRGISILQASISRQHAELVQDGNGQWVLTDLDSSNGSWYENKRIQGSKTLQGNGIIAFGEIGMYLIQDGSNLSISGPPASTDTDRLRKASLNPSVQVGQDESTFDGFPTLEIQLIQPTTGAGGLFGVSNERIQLTAAQYDLIYLLVERMEIDAKQPLLIRGFVPTPELVARIAWNTPSPSDNHLKQLVRRVRKMLITINLGNLIESRRGFGYRLRCIPILKNH